MSEAKTDSAVIEETPIQEITSPWSPKPLKRIFKDLAVCEYRPRPVEKCRVLVWGLPKSGKTTFVCSNPDAIVLDFEGGANAVVHPRAYVVDLSPASGDVLNRYQKIKNLLIEDARSVDPQFKVVVIDSIDFMADRWDATFCAENGITDLGEYRSGGAGYHRVNMRILDELRTFEDAGYGIMLVGHLSEKSYDDSGNQRFRIVPNIRDSLLRPLARWADQILTIASVPQIVYPTKRVPVPGKPGEYRTVEIKTEPQTVNRIVLQAVKMSDNHNTGCRVQIPGQLELPEADGYQVYKTAYETEVQRVREHLSDSNGSENGNNQ